ncbi:MAG TPA: trehalose-phosphatase [Candidatus Acidoferrales bacterium]|nr:trehalose-phosphatase [Candidatus Acidoferrales bacterium]
MTVPHHLFRAWKQVLTRAERAGRVILFTDFDGTLAPIKRHPQAVNLHPAVRRALSELAERGILRGVVSGRSLGDLIPRIAIPGIWYVGAHGFFLRDPRDRRFSLLNAKQRKQISRAHEELARLLRGLPAIRLEPKAATVAVHYRGASPRSREQARLIIARILTNDRNLRLLHGKKVWQILPKSSVDKGAAIRFILRREAAKPAPLTLAFYVGDDETDELAFRRLRGISIRVGKSRRTAASYYLKSPAEVRQFLEKIGRIPLHGQTRTL